MNKYNLPQMNITKEHCEKAGTLFGVDWKRFYENYVAAHNAHFIAYIDPTEQTLGDNENT